MEEVYDGVRNHYHYGDPIEVAQIEVVDTALGSPTFDQDCSVTENSHDLIAVSRRDLCQPFADLLAL